MPLSEEELRLLEQMEHALAQEDPKFASTLRGSTLERVAQDAHHRRGSRLRPRHRHAHGRRHEAQIWLGVLGFVVMLASATIGLAAWRGRHAPPAQPQRSGEDQLFDFDDQPRRFDVIDGGRTERPAPPAPPGRQARPQARQQGPQAGHLHAAHGAALGAPPPTGLLTPRPLDSAARSAPAPPQHRHRPQPAAPVALPVHAADHHLAPRVHGRHRAARAARRRRCPRRSTGPTRSAVAPTLHPDQQPLQRLEVLGPRHSPGRPPGAPARAVSGTPASPAPGRAPSPAAPPRHPRRGGPGWRAESRRRRWTPAYQRRARPPGPATTISATSGHHGTGRTPAAIGIGVGRRRIGVRSRRSGWRHRSGWRRASPRLADWRVHDGRRAGALARGRLEAHPAHPGEVHLRPRVPVVAGVEDPAVRLGGAVQEPDHHA